ncbi:MAG: hypothetical protein ACI30S_02950, partial [Muribaculaceae bacterium]
MKDKYVIGQYNMSDFTQWWEANLPCYLLLYCNAGNAKMQVQFKSYNITCGMRVYQNSICPLMLIYCKI